MKSLFKLFFISILFFNIMFTISCGLPDITSIYQEMNQPFITKLIPGPNKVTVEFQAQNNEPAFSGYNIYFGDSVNPQKYKLYNQQKTRPTIITKNSQNITTHSYTIETGSYYSTGGDSEVTTLTQSEIQNGIPIYVWVSAYQITSQNESIYYFDYAQMATPRAETLNTTVSSGSTITSSKQLATLSGAAGNLTFQSTSGGGIQTRSATSLSDVTIPPTDGYTKSPLTVEANKLYLTKTEDGGKSYYGKIFVKGVNGTTATVDYCLQTAADVLSY
ncbi:hypothetical protein [Brachyspira aalborgi]|uniref:Uncharacterized protein n=1 Tax=Brachyspira aalborgi TaxID=29522 RepID=A0A5C8G9N6_9SPIR|nr:hypothetical protein [Brachyspira aalborgi]TXJ58158.1 hypothetical protein EPJ76_01520 [Brachyspira aalborgi]